MNIDSKNYGPELWSGDAWQREAFAWIAGSLDSHGAELQGTPEIFDTRPWSVIIKGLTNNGPVWFKACGPGTGFEIPLYGVLHDVVPDHVLTPIARDDERRWILLPDGGPILDEVAGDDGLVDAMLDVLPRYAELQLALAGHVGSMLKCGVQDMRAPVIMQRYDDAIEISRRYVASHGHLENHEEEKAMLAKVEAERERFAEIAQRLGESTIPASIDHNDIHLHNVFVNNQDGKRCYRLFDWGDSVISHPLASFLVLRRVLKWRLKGERDHPDILRVRDAYLEPFATYGSHAELCDQLEMACYLGTAARAHVWQRAIFESADPDDLCRPLYSLAWCLEGLG